MKKLLLLPAILLLSGSIFLASCGNAGSDTTMKSPTLKTADSAKQNERSETGENESNEKEGKENEKDQEKKNLNQAAMTKASDVKSKTIANMQDAFKGETTASAKYAAYAKKAEQDGYHQIALLFKAASTSENIHANNHKAVLLESGAVVPAIKSEYTVKSTKENLEDAIKGESYEVATMYPDFIKTANEAENQIALISLNYAYKTEKKHKVLYETALAALQNNTVKTLATVYYVCSTCGNTYETKAPARCGISMTPKERFISIISL